jgi:hypothetical protein
MRVRELGPPSMKQGGHFINRWNPNGWIFAASTALVERVDLFLQTREPPFVSV